MLPWVSGRERGAADSSSRGEADPRTVSVTLSQCECIKECLVDVVYAELLRIVKRVLDVDRHLHAGELVLDDEVDKPFDGASPVDPDRGYWPS